MPGLFAGEVSGGSFAIGGGVAGGKVSWTITAVRADKWALANHPGVEIDKGDSKGKFVHPELFGASKEDRLNTSRVLFKK